MNIKNWIVPILRWLSWGILSIGLAAGFFVIYDTVNLVTARMFARQAIILEQSGQWVDLTRLAGFTNLGILMFALFSGMGVVSLSVFLEYYLRAGEQMGVLLKRIALALGLEAGGYIVLVLVQFAVSAFG